MPASREPLRRPSSGSPWRWLGSRLRAIFSESDFPFLGAGGLVFTLYFIGNGFSECFGHGFGILVPCLRVTVF